MAIQQPVQSAVDLAIFRGGRIVPGGLGAACVDIDPVTSTVDPAPLEAAITSRTKAIVVVHLHGPPADPDRITEIAARRGLLDWNGKPNAMRAASTRGRPTRFPAGMAVRKENVGRLRVRLPDRPCPQPDPGTLPDQCANAFEEVWHHRAALAASPGSTRWNRTIPRRPSNPSDLCRPEVDHS